MNTKEILLITNDKTFSELLKISAMTLTKLNCQVTIDESTDETQIIAISSKDNLNLVIIDYDNLKSNIINLIKSIRNNLKSGFKKIIVLHSNDIDKNEIFNAGCDSIMSKKEFEKNLNNILIF